MTTYIQNSREHILLIGSTGYFRQGRRGGVEKVDGVEEAIVQVAVPASLTSVCRSETQLVFFIV